MKKAPSLSAAKTPRIDFALDLFLHRVRSFDHERLIILSLLGQEGVRLAKPRPLCYFLCRHVAESPQRAPDSLLNLLQCGAQPNVGRPNLDHLVGTTQRSLLHREIKEAFRNIEPSTVLDNKGVGMIQTEPDRFDFGPGLARSKHERSVAGSKGAQRLAGCIECVGDRIKQAAIQICKQEHLRRAVARLAWACSWS